MEALNRRVRQGVSSWDNSFNNLGGKLSGPVALKGLTIEKPLGCLFIRESQSDCSINSKGDFRGNLETPLDPPWQCT